MVCDDITNIKGTHVYALIIRMQINSWRIFEYIDAWKNELKVSRRGYMSLKDKNTLLTHKNFPEKTSIFLWRVWNQINVEHVMNIQIKIQ